MADRCTISLMTNYVSGTPGPRNSGEFVAESFCFFVGLRRALSDTRYKVKYTHARGRPPAPTSTEPRRRGGGALRPADCAEPPSQLLRRSGATCCSAAGGGSAPARPAAVRGGSSDPHLRCWIDGCRPPSALRWPAAGPLCRPMSALPRRRPAAGPLPAGLVTLAVISRAGRVDVPMSERAAWSPRPPPTPPARPSDPPGEEPAAYLRGPCC